MIPKGCVLLTAAVDRLAEARRTAGQTSDEGQNAAREELRAELHSESMLAMVISSCSGDTFAIRSRHWAREIALTWLEQGECLLNEDFVGPWPLSMALSAQSVGSPESIRAEHYGLGRWPSLRRGERSPIFLTEHDLQRLMAKQEVKQEATRLDGKKIWSDKPLGRKRGAKQSAVWVPLLDHLDGVVARGEIANLATDIFDEARRWLEKDKRSLSDDALRRGIKRNRPKWFEA